MRFGLHFLLSCSANHTPAELYRDALEQAVLGEQLGFESVWPVEQHFNSDVSVMPCPAIMLAAIAARTQTLRLCTGIVQLPLTHPLRVAEELATLDVLSGGRAELGVGRGSNAAHFEGFGLRHVESRARFEEAFRFLRGVLAEPRFSFTGQYYQASGLSLSPAPLQRPGFKMHIAVNSPDTARFAGAQGCPVILASHVNPFPKLDELLAVYGAARLAHGHTPTTRDDVTLLMPLYVAETRAQVEAEITPSITQFVRLFVQNMDAVLTKISTEAERTMMLAIRARLESMDFASINESMGIFATPEQCAERLSELAQRFSAGRVIAWFNFAGVLSDASTQRAMRLFSERVIPAVA